MFTKKTGISEMNYSSPVWRIFSYLVMAFVVAISILPMIWIFASSFKTNAEVLDSAFSLPTKFSLDAYVDAWTYAKMGTYFANSIVISIGATIVALLFYAMAGYVLARFPFPGKSILIALFGITLLVPAAATIQPVFFLINNVLHLFNTQVGLMVVYIGLGLPISIFVLQSFFATIPREMEEAAYMEGAGFNRVFYTILLPLAQPALASAGVLMFLANWNEFLFALILTRDESTRTLPLALSYFTGQFSFNYPAMFAAITMAIIPSIVIYVILQEKITESLGGGALKE